MKKYFFEAVNPKAPLPTGPASVANRLPINSVTERSDGKVDIHVKFKGIDKAIPVDPSIRFSQNQRNMIFRNQYGIPVPVKEVINELKESKK